MFDDLTLDQLTALRTQLRDAWTKLVSGALVVEVRYGELGHKFAPTSSEACEALIGKVQTAIDKLNGCSGGALFPVGV